jgi:molecular chaperone DnaJ
MAAQRDWYEKDFYKVLGVSDTATPKEITKAYRKLARENHPDTNPGNTAAENRFKDASAAYDVVGDDAKRKEYDEVRKLGPVGPYGAGGQGGGGFGGGGGQPGGFNFNVGADGLGDLLGGMFNRGGRGRGASAGGGPQRGQDLEASLTLDFVDAVQGLTTTLYLTSDAQCSTCNGSGAKPGTHPRTCSICGGRGVIDDNQGFFAMSSPCRNCQGRGVIIEQACPTCHGSGVEKKAREVKVRLPAGVADGQKIRLKGRGGPGRNGGPAGDLLVECHVVADKFFGRDGTNLTVRVPVTFAEAALGGDIDVPTLDGQTVKLRLKSGTQSNTRHRVKGKGIETTKHTGDLIVTVDVHVPTSLNAEQRAAVEAFAAATTVSPRAHMPGAPASKASAANSTADADQSSGGGHDHAQ